MRVRITKINLASGKNALLLSRLFLSAAFFCPTLYWLAAESSTVSWKKLFWGLAIAGLSSSFFSIEISLAAACLLTPLIVTMLGYIALNGLPPYPDELFDTILHSSIAETNAGWHYTSVVPGFIIWMIVYFLFLLLAFLFALRAGPSRRERNGSQNTLALVFICVLVLVTSVVFKTNAPFWVALSTDVQETVYGEAGLLVFAAIFNHESINESRQPSEAHEKTQITHPLLSILVIGESMRADSLGPNTASRGVWSKELNERMAQGLGSWMPQVCAPHDSTYISVPALITGTPPNIFHYYYNKKIGPYLGAAAGRDLFGFKAGLYMRPTGLARLKSAGFDIGWISSGRQDLFAGPEIRKGDGILYRSSVVNYFTDTKGPYDGDLLQPIAGFIAPMTQPSYDGKPKALVVHLYGNHLLYNNRYPDDVFGPEPVGLSDEALQSLQYNRASEYVAKVLIGISHLLDQVSAPAFAVYTSDHGENLIQDHNGLIAHICARTSLRGIMVPFLVVWNKAAERAGFPQKVLSDLAKAKRLAQIDIYNAWMSLSGLDGGDAVHATQNPLVFGAVNVGDTFDAIPCDNLKP